MAALLQSRATCAVTVGIAVVAALGLQIFKDGQSGGTPDSFDGLPKPDRSYFFSVGDFGVRQCEIGYKAGHLEKDGGIGHPDCHGDNQQLVADSMARLAATLRPAFVLSLGDNFYVRGVKSLEDFQFNGSFEDVYSTGDLAEVPWKISLGDHDQRGNVSALLLHSNRSSRWNLEAPYYGHRLPLPGSNGSRHVQLLVLDSVGLEGGVSKELLATRRFVEDYSPEFTGPAAAAAQWHWVEEQLGAPQGASLALFMVAAHRPVLSMVKRSRSKAERAVEARLRPLLQGASRQAPVVYVNGHDHAMQLFSEPGQRLHYLVNGVGGMGLHHFVPPDTPGAPSKEFVWGNNSSYGFLVHELGPTSMDMHFIDAATGHSLHSARVSFAA